MDHKLFHAPISVQFGCGTKGQISSLGDMHRCLADWPQRERGPVYDNAYKASVAAAAGYITIEQARRALVRFLDGAGVLHPEVTSAFSARVITRSHDGFAA